jgi:hypothetical protein
VTLVERAILYNMAFPEYPESWLKASDRWISGTWILGNDYRGSGMYGSYPPGYLRRVSALFPDKPQKLHVFSGSLPRSATRDRVTVDIRVSAVDNVYPGIQADVGQLPFRNESFDLCYADPPYSEGDAEHYGVRMPNRRAILHAIHPVIRPGGFLIWLDTVLPMYRKDMWNWCGAIGMWRSSNHRIRGVMLFERV